MSMLTKITTIITAATMISTLALADNDHDNDAWMATTVKCRVLDATGTEIPPTSLASSFQGSKLVISGEGELFSFSAELDKAAGVLSLTDKRSGHKVTVKDGDFDIDEVVSFSLITDEAPNAPISLECVGK